MPALRALADSGHDIAAVLTRPDAPVGRKRTLTPSPVKQMAHELGIPVVEASRLRGEVLDEIEALDLDAAAVVAYGALAGPRALAATRLGWYNLHFSLLPAYRGAAPVQRALIDGQTTSGVTVFRLDTGMDTGDIVAQESFALPGPESSSDAGDVLADYAQRGAPVLVRALDEVAAGTAVFRPQPAAGTSAPKIDPAEAQLDFTQPAAAIAASARGTSPAPGPWALMEGKRTKLAGVAVATAAGLADGDTNSTTAGTSPLPQLAPGELLSAGGTVYAGTGVGLITIASIQPFGKPLTPAVDVLRGRPGARFDIPAAEGAVHTSAPGSAAQEQK